MIGAPRAARTPVSRRIRVVALIGTRPEMIKMSAVIRCLRLRAEEIETTLVVSGQHAELVHRAIDAPGLRIDHDLAVMQERQTPSEVCSRVMERLDPLLDSLRPDWVLIQGDSTTALAGALAAFHAGVRVAHVEAGLRCPDPGRPFPEEMNRRLITRIAALHLAATRGNAAALEAEGVDPSRVVLTGNPGVDALQRVFESRLVPVELRSLLADPRRILLFTMHRRENQGSALELSLSVLRRFAERHADVRIVYPVHPNPRIASRAVALLEGVAGVCLLEPLRFEALVPLLARAWLVVTDSGGIQEEAAALDRRMIVIRGETERPEALRDGVRVLVPPAELEAALERFTASAADAAPAERVESPFGDGRSAERIVDAILAHSRSAPVGTAATRRDFDAAITRIETWLVEGAIQLPPDRSEAGGITGWIEPHGIAGFVYGEITGYYLAWWRFLRAARPAVADRARDRAVRAFAWLERSFARGPAPPTFAGDAVSHAGFRNDVVFSFDLAMMFEGVCASEGLVEPARRRRLALRIADALGDFCNDASGILPFRLRDPSASVPPQRWSTGLGPHRIKLAEWLLAAPSALLPQRILEAASVTSRLERDRIARPTTAGSVHAHLYGCEGLLRRGGTRDVDLAAEVWTRIVDRQSEPRWLPDWIEDRRAAGRLDVMAQALRVGSWLQRTGRIDERRVLDDLAASILAAQHPSGALPFRCEGTESLHLNVWTSIFSHQALLAYRAIDEAASDAPGADWIV